MIIIKTAYDEYIYNYDKYIYMIGIKEGKKALEKGTGWIFRI